MRSVKAFKMRTGEGLEVLEKYRFGQFVQKNSKAPSLWRAYEISHIKFVETTRNQLIFCVIPE